MIELRVIDPKHFAPGIRIGHIGVVNRDLPFGDHILVIEWVWIRDSEISPLPPGVVERGENHDDQPGRDIEERTGLEVDVRDIDAHCGR